MIRRRKYLERGTPPKRKAYLPRSRKPIAARGPAKARREAKYRKFLASAAWKRLRTQKLEESPVCELALEGCLVSERLTVHHTTYARFGGKERMSDLQTACRPCHNRHHALEGKHVA